MPFSVCSSVRKKSARIILIKKWKKKRTKLKEWHGRKKSQTTTVKILMFYFFLFYRLSQSTKLHPRVLITSIAKTQRGKFSRESSLLCMCPLVRFRSRCMSIIRLIYFFILFYLLSVSSSACTMVAHTRMLFNSFSFSRIFREFTLACLCVVSLLSVILSFSFSFPFFFTCCTF